MNSERSNYAKTIRKIAWGYFFLYIDVNLNGWSILPAWFGWYKFDHAIGILREPRPKLALLKNFAVALLLWRVVMWQRFFELPGWFAPVRIIFELMELYFHFHLLTELSALASRLLSQRILRCRTASIVMETAFILIVAMPVPQEIIGYMALPLVLVRFFVCLYIMLSIFNLAKELEQPELEN